MEIETAIHARFATRDGDQAKCGISYEYANFLLQNKARECPSWPYTPCQTPRPGQPEQIPAGLHEDSCVQR